MLIHQLTLMIIFDGTVDKLCFDTTVIFTKCSGKTDCMLSLYYHHVLNYRNATSFTNYLREKYHTHTHVHECMQAHTLTQAHTRTQTPTRRMRTHTTHARAHAPDYIPTENEKRLLSSETSRIVFELSVYD